MVSQGSIRHKRGDLSSILRTHMNQAQWPVLRGWALVGGGDSWVLPTTEHQPDQPREPRWVAQCENPEEQHPEVPSDLHMDAHTKHSAPHLQAQCTQISYQKVTSLSGPGD